MAIMKRIHSVTICRMIDNDPDTSWLGEYSRNSQGEFSIDRKHTFECASQDYNQDTETINKLERILRYLDGQRFDDSLSSYQEEWQDIFADAIMEATDLIENVQGNVTECDCEESGNWSHGELRYFNASSNIEAFDPNATWIPVDVQDKQAYWRESMLTSFKSDYDSMESYNNGDWCFVGIRAEAKIVIGNVCQTITSGGLWGTESDSDDFHFASIEDAELHELRSQLSELGFSKRAIATAFKSVAHKDGR
jgi:hypothetical protein